MRMKETSMIRLTNPASGAFWEGHVEGVTFVATTGADGKKPRTTEKSFSDEWKARSFAQSRQMEKLRDGFVYASDEPGSGWRLTLQTAAGRVHTGFQSLEFIPEQDLILAAFGRKEGEECDLIFLNARTGQVTESVTLPFFDLWQIRADPSRDCLYFRVDGGVYRFDLKSRTHHRIAATPPLQWTRTFDLSRSGHRICLSEKGHVVVRDVDTEQELWRTPIPRSKPVTGDFSAALSPDGERAAVAFEPGRIDVCTLATGEVKALTGDFQYPSSLAFHPSGRCLAVSERFGSPSLRLFDLESGDDLTDQCAPLQTPSGEAIRGAECDGVDFSPNGDCLFVRSRGVVTLYVFETGEVLGTLRPDLVLRPQMDTGFQMLASRSPHALVCRTDLGAILVYRCGA
jgi:hypothetical protein